jgi:outer membrane protein W
MRRSVLRLAVGMTVALATSSALAQEEGGKIHLGARLGYGIPMGKVTGDITTPLGTAEGVKLSDAYSGMIPIWLDLGYFVTPQIMVGVYGHYGIGLIADGEAGGAGCQEGEDCSGSVIRFGVQGQYHLSRGESLDPWFGLGIGYEMASGTVSEGGAEQTATYKGFEFLNLQAGADFKVANNVGIGPFASFSLGQYSSLSVDPEPPGFEGDIEETAMHQWLVIGVHGAFGF